MALVFYVGGKDKMVNEFLEGYLQKGEFASYIYNFQGEEMELLISKEFLKILEDIKKKHGDIYEDLEKTLEDSLRKFINNEDPTAVIEKRGNFVRVYLKGENLTYEAYIFGKDTQEIFGRFVRELNEYMNIPKVAKYVKLGNIEMLKIYSDVKAMYKTLKDIVKRVFPNSISIDKNIGAFITVMKNGWLEKVEYLRTDEIEKGKLGKVIDSLIREYFGDIIKAQK